MARGKQGKESAVRRAEAAMELVDRLNDRLIEASTRARRYEADAALVPTLQAHISRLQDEVKADINPKIAAAATARADELAAMEAERDLAVSVVVEVMKRVLKEAPEVAVVNPYTMSTWERLPAFRPVMDIFDGGSNRSTRRYFSTKERLDWLADFRNNLRGGCVRPEQLSDAPWVAL